MFYVSIERRPDSAGSTRPTAQVQKDSDHLVAVARVREELADTRRQVNQLKSRLAGHDTSFGALSEAEGQEARMSYEPTEPKPTSRPRETLEASLPDPNASPRPGSAPVKDKPMTEIESARSDTPALTDNADDLPEKDDLASASVALDRERKSVVPGGPQGPGRGAGKAAANTRTPLDAKQRKQIQEALDQVDDLKKTVSSLEEQVRTLRKPVEELEERKLAMSQASKQTPDLEDSDAGSSTGPNVALRPSRRAETKVASPPAARKPEPKRDAVDRELLARIERLEKKQKRLEQALSVSYRMAAADGRDGLAGWQIAAVRAQLVRRAGLLRSSASGDKTRKLIDRVEFLLLRLEQMDPTDAAARKRLADQIQQGQLLEMIDARIEADAEPVDVHTWLLEARVILEGVRDAV
jgi:hypothetical protein